MGFWLWGGFLLLVVGLLALDLGVFHRKGHVVGLREAVGWTVFYVLLALAFNVGVYFLYEHGHLDLGGVPGTPDGRAAALQFFTAWLVEKSLSLDNLFVIALIFANLQVPARWQHRVLFWGIVGALAMRGVMIAAGGEAIRRFDWIVYVFGGLLLLTAVRLLVARHDNVDVDRSLLVRLARRFYPVSTAGFGEGKFVLLHGGRRAMTPLFVALLAVEGADLLFAVDSIPACFAVTRDTFLVFTSNVFAILGLRSLFFALSGFMHRFRYMKMSLVFLLAYVAVKMMLAHHFPIPAWVSLCIIAGILSVGVVASMTAAHRDTAPLAPPPR